MMSRCRHIELLMRSDNHAPVFGLTDKLVVGRLLPTLKLQ